MALGSTPSNTTEWPSGKLSTVLWVAAAADVVEPEAELGVEEVPLLLELGVPDAAAVEPVPPLLVVPPLAAGVPLLALMPPVLLLPLVPVAPVAPLAPVAAEAAGLPALMSWAVARTLAALMPLVRMMWSDAGLKPTMTSLAPWPRTKVSVPPLLTKRSFPVPSVKRLGSGPPTSTSLPAPAVRCVVAAASAWAAVMVDEDEDEGVEEDVGVDEEEGVVLDVPPAAPPAAVVPLAGVVPVVPPLLGVELLVEVPPAAAPLEEEEEADDPLGGVRLVITRTSLPGPACNVLPGNPMMRSPAPLPVTVAVGDCATSILVMPWPAVAAAGVEAAGVAAADPGVAVVPVELVEPVIPFVEVVAIALTPAKLPKLPVKTRGAPKRFVPISPDIQRNAANPPWRGVTFPSR